MTSSTSPTISGPSAEVGSSTRISAGFIAIARVITTRYCCGKPRRAFHGMVAGLTRASYSAARARASRSLAPSTRCGPIVMLWSADKCEKRLKRGKTMLTRRRLRAAALGGSAA